MTNKQFEKVAEQFDRDVAEHAMTVLRDDDGVYRHIRFTRPDTRNMYFDLVTWPGYLCFCGDMGEYVFSRLEDMFEFFRKDGGISYDYWAEKCRAGDKSHSARGEGNGITQFSEELFKEAVEEDFKSWRETNAGLLEEDPEFLEEIRERLNDDVLSCSNEGMIRAYDAAAGFTVMAENIFTDFWEHDCEDYTFHFIWCCHAIRWGVARYDAWRRFERDKAADKALKEE